MTKTMTLETFESRYLRADGTSAHGRYATEQAARDAQTRLEREVAHEATMTADELAARYSFTYRGKRTSSLERRTVKVTGIARSTMVIGVGDQVEVWAYGARRTGTVTKLGRTRVTVRFIRNRAGTVDERPFGALEVWTVNTVTTELDAPAADDCDMVLPEPEVEVTPATEITHRHADGREHAHGGREGFEIGGQVIADTYGDNVGHSHSILGRDNSNSGRVTWSERLGDVVTDRELLCEFYAAAAAVGGEVHGLDEDAIEVTVQAVVQGALGMTDEQVLAALDDVANRHAGGITAEEVDAIHTRRDVARMTDDQLERLEDWGDYPAELTDTADAHAMDVATWVEQEIEQREYANSDDERVREGTGNSR